MRVRIEIATTASAHVGEERREIASTREFSDYLPQNADVEAAREDLLRAVGNFARNVADDFIRAGR